MNENIRNMVDDRLEARVAVGAARSADWITAEYNNQYIPDKNNTGGFYTVGAETAVGGGGGGSAFVYVPPVNIW